MKGEAMTDRELLEMAAKAAGFEVARWSDDDKDLLLIGVQEPWNPLADDGDALRLAVKLRILIEPCRTMGGKFLEVHAYPSGRGDCSGVERLGIDDASATRRAIVRAAAALSE